MSSLLSSASRSSKVACAITLLAAWISTLSEVLSKPSISVKATHAAHTDGFDKCWTATLYALHAACCILKRQKEQSHHYFRFTKTTVEYDDVKSVQQRQHLRQWRELNQWQPRHQSVVRFSDYWATERLNRAWFIRGIWDTLCMRHELYHLYDLIRCVLDKSRGHFLSQLCEKLASY